jgi:hypothetical protein
MRAKCTYLKRAILQTSLTDDCSIHSGESSETVQTDISLSELLAIQEKRVSAWEFEPELEIASCFIEAEDRVLRLGVQCTEQFTCAEAE